MTKCFGRSVSYAREGAWSDPTDWTPEDERLLGTVCERLTDDPRIDASDIEVEVKQQVVTLHGSVPDRRTKYAVEELVANAGARATLRISCE